MQSRDFICTDLDDDLVSFKLLSEANQGWTLFIFTAF